MLVPLAHRLQPYLSAILAEVVPRAAGRCTELLVEEWGSAR